MSYLQELLYNEKCFYQVTLGLFFDVFPKLKSSNGDFHDY